jgi:Co/Zn/Cd efflux system component
MGILEFLKTVVDALFLFVYTFFVYLEAVFRFFFPPALKSLAGEVILVSNYNL